MTYEELKTKCPELATIFKACGYSEKEAIETIRNWRTVRTDDRVRIESDEKANVRGKR